MTDRSWSSIGMVSTVCGAGRAKKIGGLDFMVNTRWMVFGEVVGYVGGPHSSGQ
jgi:hypothetical protein